RPAGVFLCLPTARTLRERSAKKGPFRLVSAANLRYWPGDIRYSIFFGVFLRPIMERKQEVVQDVVIKFAGDSGDGMQLTGTQFTNNTAMLGSDLSTFPDFPAEIRAPQGTLPGVSGYQLRFSSDSIYTPGDAFAVLLSLNASALKTNVK